MHLATVEYEGHELIGAVKDDKFVVFDGLAPDMLALIQGGSRLWDKAHRIADAEQHPIPLSQVRLMAPIPHPHKNIFAVGRNYGEHAKEAAAARGQKEAGPPVIFTKAPTTVNSPSGDIVVDPGISEQIDWEVELAVIIGHRMRQVRRAEALGGIFDYAVMNDVTARDLQNRTSQFFIGKSVDGYGPFGPWIVTADEIRNPGDLTLVCRVNGTVKQEGNTRDMIYDLATIIEHLASVLTLEPGDIISTGTPAGVGFARRPQEFLKPGDILESEIRGIGTLRNRIVGP